MITFRINYIKSNISEVENVLEKNNISFDKQVIEVKDLKETAYIISDDVDVRDLDIYKDGKIYVQNVSSMYPALYLYNEIKSGDILDMCAAPGGKTLHLQSISNNAFNITAIEKDKKRFERMKYNFDLQGVKAFSKQISGTDLDDFLKFDVIILDAPCSGSGTEKGISAEKGSGTEKGIESADSHSLDISRFVKMQRKLIDKAVKLLKKDGILLYSTCSIYEEEDEEERDYILGKGLKLKEERKIDKTTSCEGFYIAVFCYKKHDNIVDF